MKILAMTVIPANSSNISKQTKDRKTWFSFCHNEKPVGIYLEVFLSEIKIKSEIIKSHKNRFAAISKLKYSNLAEAATKGNFTANRTPRIPPNLFCYNIHMKFLNFSWVLSSHKRFIPSMALILLLLGLEFPK